MEFDYVKKSLNSRKNNRIPEKEDIKKLEIRNRRLLKILEQEQPEDIHLQLRLSIEKSYLMEHWIRV